MNVFMLKDVEKVGMAGTIVKISDGYAINFLIPRKLAIKATKKDIFFHKNRTQKVEVERQIIGSKVAMLAERLRNLHLTLEKKVHDDDKLYGSVNADEVVSLLKEKSISINKKQVEFFKTIRTLGEHKVVIRLSSKLRPEVTVKVISGK